MKKFINIAISIIISIFFFIEFREEGYEVFPSLITAYTCASGSFLGTNLAELFSKVTKPDFIIYSGTSYYIRTKLYFFIGINIIGGVLGAIFLGLYGMNILFSIFKLTFFFRMMLLIFYSLVLIVLGNYCFNYSKSFNSKNGGDY